MRFDVVEYWPCSFPIRLSSCLSVFPIEIDQASVESRHHAKLCYSVPLVYVRDGEAATVIELPVSLTMPGHRRDLFLCVCVTISGPLSV